MADASTAHSVFDWLQIITLGGLLGSFGQGIRTIVGLKKINDAAASAEVSSADLFVASRVLVSLAIGFIVGGVSAMTIVNVVPGTPPKATLEQLMTLAALGYTGTDAIEGFMKRVAGAPGSKGQESVGVGGATSAAADVQDGAVG